LSGNLYIVSTPIGNLGDVTFRSLEILKDVDCIACEDTRVTKKLLNHYNIKSKLIIYNDINECKVMDNIVKLIVNGKNIALVSDAGTPCISDPGYRLVNNCYKNNIEVLSVPGPSSVVSALSISGLPTDSFYFSGFLPRKKGRSTKFEVLSEISSTIIIFESPYRILKTLKDIYKFMGNRVISLCKEITKIHENVYYGYVEEIIDDLEKNTNIKGEFVILIAKEGYIIK
tara:strand:+ start:43 stop:729 length:687 start_codon:yes stop_codon:yes gene_type:complete